MRDDILDSGRLEWQHTLQKIKRKLTNEASVLEDFDKVRVHTMLSVLGTGGKLCGAIKHLTLVGVSFGRCVVLGAGVGCPPGLVVYGFSFCNGFFICAQKKKDPQITIQGNINTQTDTKTRSQI